jgi:hypothetical protein
VQFPEPGAEHGLLFPAEIQAEEDLDQTFPSHPSHHHESEEGEN